MRKLLILIINFFCPGIIFFLNQQYLKMLIAFGLQISIIGWIPAIIWARHNRVATLKANTPKPTIKRAKSVPNLTNQTPKESPSDTGESK